MFPFYIATKGIPTTTHQKRSQFYLEPWAYQVSSLPKLLFKESTLVHGVEQENDLSTNDSCPIKPGNFDYWWWLVMKEVKHIPKRDAANTCNDWRLSAYQRHFTLGSLDLKYSKDTVGPENDTRCLFIKVDKLYKTVSTHRMHLVSIFVSILSLGFWPALSG